MKVQKPTIFTATLFVLFFIASGCDSNEMNEFSGITWELISDWRYPSPVVAPDGTLYAVGNGGLSRFVEDTGSWEVILSVEPPARIVRALAAGPAGKVCVGGAREAVTYVDGLLFCSNDGGDTWQEVPHMPFLLRSGISDIEFTEAGDIFVGTSGDSDAGSEPLHGLYVSHDGGASWEATSLVNERGGLDNLFIGPDGFQLAVFRLRPDGYFMYHCSTNGGETYEPCNLPFSLIAIPIMPIIATDDNDLFAVGSESISGENIRGVYRSSDWGDTWVRTELLTPRNLVYDIASDGERVYAGAGFEGVYATADGGTTWEPINDGFPLSPLNTVNVDVSRLLFTPDGHLIAGTSQGLFKTTQPVR